VVAIDVEKLWMSLPAKVMVRGFWWKRHCSSNVAARDTVDKVVIELLSCFTNLPVILNGLALTLTLLIKISLRNGESATLDEYLLVQRARGRYTMSRHHHPTDPSSTDKFSYRAACCTTAGSVLIAKLT
jgi:hypothetical protein